MTSHVVDLIAAIAGLCSSGLGVVLVLGGRRASHRHGEKVEGVRVLVNGRLDQALQQIECLKDRWERRGSSVRAEDLTDGVEREGRG